MKTEKFTASLSYLNDAEKLESHIDSIVNYSGNQLLYAHVLDSILMERFYHGYSVYDYSNNYIASAAGDLFGLKFSAIVLPDDILKHPKAACSQQAMVFQEILKRKGAKYRKVGFQNKNVGHFCTEVQVNGKNYFFDSNQEAYWKNPAERISTAELVKSKDQLYGAYINRHDHRYEAYYLAKPIYGEWNSFPAKNARLFQVITNFVSHYDIYIMIITFLLIFLLKKRKIQNTYKSQS